MVLIIALIGYMLGIIWGLYFGKSMALFFIILGLFGLFVKTKNLKREGKKSRLKWIFVCIFLVMFFFGNYRIEKQEKDRESLVEQLEQMEEERYLGTVVGKLEESQYQYSCIVKLEEIGKKKLARDKKIKLVMKKKDKFSMNYGDKIQFQGQWEEFEEQRNDGGWNPKETFLAKGIYGKVLLVGEGKVIKQGNIDRISMLAFTMKEKLESNFKKIFPQEVSNFLKGILIGEKSGIDEEIIENFKVTNLSHLLAVSGMHVGYLVMGVKITTKKYKRIGSYITIVILIFFMFVVGFTSSVVRACLMGIMGGVGSLLYRKANTWIGICLSLFMILLQNPFAINETGLLLSYGGTIGILVFQPQLKEKTDRIFLLRGKKIFSFVTDILSVTFAAQIVIMPIMLLKFGTVSFTFFLSNLLVSPFLGIFVVGGFVIFFLSCISITMAKIPAFLLTIVIRILLGLVDSCAKIPFSQVYCTIPKWWQIVGYYLGMFCFISKPVFFMQKWRMYRRKVILIVLSFCILWAIVSKIPKEFQLYFIDVGQGDSSLVISPTGKRILIDGGGNRSLEQWDVGENTLVPFLLNKGIYRIDYLMISHFDADHCNGTIAVLEKLWVKEVIISRQASSSEEYDRILEIIKKKKIKVRVVKSGDKISVDSYVRINILHPQEDLLQDGKGGLNSNSIVAMVEYKKVHGRYRILFTGDIEADAEKVLKGQNTDWKADILKVAHHGSKTSSTEEFVKRISPKIALIRSRK